MMITAILVTYNSETVITSALNCVYRHPKVAECIVVDNASTDSTRNIIQSEFPEVKIIANTDNAGFGRACNQALTQVSTELALLLNPDAFIDSDGINKLAEAFSLYPEAAIIAPYLEHQGNRRQITFLMDDASTQEDIIPSADINAISMRFVSGALAVWRMEHMKKVGFFDPAFFLFYEDDDISIRVRQAGYQMLAITGINVRHTPGKSCAMTPYVQSLKLRSSTWSYLYILNKYKGKGAAVRAAFALLARNIGAFRGRGSPVLRIQQLQDIFNIFDEVWLEMKNQLESQLTLATTEYNQRLVDAEKLRDEKYKHTEETISSQWQQIVDKHKEKEAYLINGFHTTDNAEESLRRFKALVSALEDEWAELNRQHEHDRQKAAEISETHWQMTERSFQEKWKNIFKAHEKRLQQLTRAHEKKRAAAQKKLASLYTYRERHDKVWAVLYFFRNPGRFNKNDL